MIRQLFSFWHNVRCYIVIIKGGTSRGRFLMVSLVCRTVGVHGDHLPTVSFA